jgi:putative SOS response-associated peptidase YedK
MCRSYALTSPPEKVRAAFGCRERAEFPPRPDIRPTQPILVVAAREFSGGLDRFFRLVRWGFLPGFADDPGSFPLIVNARAESVREKPSFAAAFRHRRCLIPADGFVAGFRPRRLWSARDGEPLGLAGLFETYLDPNGSEIDTACILTTPANAALAPFGERMPGVISPESSSAWLDCEAIPLDEAAALLRPAPADLLRALPEDEKDFVRRVS